MAINPSKAFLFAAGGVAVVAAVAYGSGALDPYINNQKPAQVAALPQTDAKPAESSSTATEAPGVAFTWSVTVALALPGCAVPNVSGTLSAPAAPSRSHGRKTRSAVAGLVGMARLQGLGLSIMAPTARTQGRRHDAPFGNRHERGAPPPWLRSK